MRITTMTEVNLEGIKTELEVLPAGEYEAIFNDYSVGQAQSGNTTVKTVFIVSDGEYSGRRLYRNFSLLPQALWAFKKFLVDLGVSPEDLEGRVVIEEIMPEVLTAPVKIVVKSSTNRNT